MNEAENRKSVREMTAEEQKKNENERIQRLNKRVVILKQVKNNRKPTKN
jgi:hypothetical protein